MHRARVHGVPLGSPHVHLGDEGERLVGRGVHERSQPLPQRRHVCVRPQHLELVREGRSRRLVAHPDPRKPIRAFRRAVLECHVTRLAEQDVHDDALGGSQEHLLDELLVLVVPAVPAHELHPGTRDRHVEDPRVRRVREVEADNLASLRLERQFRLAGDEHDVAEAAHGHVRRLVAERRNRTILDQDVVQREQHLAVHGGPVIGVGRNDEDVAVETELLTVVLADVRVVPVRALVGAVHLVGERLPDRDRRLRVVRPVVAVLEPEPVPVHGRVEVAAVRDVDGDGRASRDLERRAGNRAVVRQHPHDGVPDPLAHRRDLELELVTVAQGHDLRAAGLRKAGRLCRESTPHVRPAGALVLHR